MKTSLVSTDHPRSNHLLAALPDAEWARWQPLLELVSLSRGQVLCNAGSSPAHVYFPTTAIVSLRQATQEGASDEIALIGHDGMVGISLFMGRGFMPGEAVVQSPGQGYRLSAQEVMQEFEHAGAVRALFLRHTQALIEHMSQTALCNRHHSIDQQLCRRLLHGMDLSSTNILPLTQESLAGLLGVRREGVTAAALKLQGAGVIRYKRGQIDVLDRGRLEQRSCECYAVTRRARDRLLPAEAGRAAAPAVMAH